MAASVLQIPQTEKQGGAGAARFTRRFFDKFDSEDLAAIRKNLELVMDERARQYDLFGEPPAAPAKTAPAVELVAQVNNDLAQILSPSQVACWLDCQAKWYFKYFRGLPDVVTASRALGTTLHKTMAVYWRALIAKEAPPDVEAMLKLYDAAWKQACEQGIRFDDDESAEDTGRQGRILCQKYLCEEAPSIQPAAAEKKVTGAIAGVKVQGYIDLLDTNGRIIDLKTAAAKPSGIKPDYAFQIATYRQLCPGASGKAAVHTLVKTKTPQLHRAEYTVSDADVRLTETLYPQCQEGMRGGLYFPNRGSNLCSRKNCAFWEACEEEYGGVTKC